MNLIVALATTDNPVADFSDTPWWLSLVKALLLFVVMVLSVLLVTWFERRVISRMQQRLGPNRFGPFGIFQTLADGVKLALTEDLTPKNADKVVFLLAPIITGGMAFVSFAIIPMGPMVTMFGHRTPLQLADTPVAVLLVLAAAGVGVYGVVLGGWSSGSTYSLLGGLRSTAQVISYEIAMGLSLIAIFLYSGSMSTSQIVASQKSLWFIIPAFFSFVVYVVTMIGETNRLPFDLAEGEGELGGVEPELIARHPVIDRRVRDEEQRCRRRRHSPPPPGCGTGQEQQHTRPEWPRGGQDARSRVELGQERHQADHRSEPQRDADEHDRCSRSPIAPSLGEHRRDQRQREDRELDPVQRGRGEHPVIPEHAPEHQSQRLHPPGDRGG